MGKLQESTAVALFLVFDLQLIFGAMSCHGFSQNKSFQVWSGLTYQLEIPVYINFIVLVYT